MRKTCAALILAFAFTPSVAAANSGDFTGAVAIGTAYAGIDTAPSNGLIVQGNVGIGTSGTLSALTVSGTIDATANSASSVAIIGITASTTGGAVLGDNTGTGYFCYIASTGYSINCNGPTAGVSDQRLKKDIQPLAAEEGLDAILKIQPVHYHWQDERMNKAHPDGEIGFVAQNVEMVLPQLVGEVNQPQNAPLKLPDGKQKVLQYDRISAPLVLAIQQLNARNDAQADALDKLSREFEAYKATHP